MKEKIIALIQSSHAIKDLDKAIYLKLIDFLDEENQKKLLAILEKEVSSMAKIEKDAVLEKSELNKNLSIQLDNFFKKEEKLAIQSEEKEEQDDSENLLTKLNDV